MGWKTEIAKRAVKSVTPDPYGKFAIRQADGTIKLKSPIPYKEGRLSGFTSPNQNVAYGYDRNGELFTIDVDRIDQDLLGQSRDGGRTTGYFSDNLFSGLAASGVAAGSLAMPEDAEAGRAKYGAAALQNARKMATKAANDVKRIGLDKGFNESAHMASMQRMLGDIEAVDNWVRMGRLDPAEGEAVRKQIWDSYAQMQGKTDTPFQVSEVGEPDVDVSDVEGLPTGMLEAGAEGAGEFIPYRAQPPLSAAQKADYNENQRLAHMMSEMPQGYGMRGMEKGYYDPFTMGIREKDINNALGPGNKQMHSVAGAAGAGYVIGNDEPDPGILAEDTVREVDGRVFSLAPTRQEIISDIPSFIGGAVSDLAGMAAGGLAATGQALGGVVGTEMGLLDSPADVDALAETSESVRGMFPGVSEDNAAMRGLEEFFLSNPRAMEALAKALGLYERGGEVADRFGPQAGVAYRAIPQTMMEVF
jgi:hypothetical protein